MDPEGVHLPYCRKHQRTPERKPKPDRYLMLHKDHRAYFLMTLVPLWLLARHSDPYVARPAQ